MTEPNAFSESSAINNALTLHERLASDPRRWWLLSELASTGARINPPAASQALSLLFALGSIKRKGHSTQSYQFERPVTAIAIREMIVARRMGQQSHRHPLPSQARRIVPRLDTSGLVLPSPAEHQADSLKAIQARANAGMSRATLESIYGRDLVTTAIGGSTK